MSTQVSTTRAQLKSEYALLDTADKAVYERQCEQFCEKIYPKLHESIVGELESTMLDVAKVYGKLREEYQSLLTQTVQLAQRVKIANAKIDAVYSEKWPRFVHKLCLKRAYKEAVSEIRAEAERVDGLSGQFLKKIHALKEMHKSLEGTEKNLAFFQKVESHAYAQTNPIAPAPERDPDAQVLCKKATLHLLRTYQRAGDAYYAEKETREKKNSA